MMVTVAILCIVAPMAVYMMKYFNHVTRQNTSFDSQRKAQAVLFQICEDVRNANSIYAVEFSSVTLVVYDFKKYGDDFSKPLATNNLLKSNTAGTITYAYTQVGADTYLERRRQFPGQTMEKEQYLKNILASPTGTDYLFRGFPSNVPPINSLEIALRVKVKMFYTDTNIYRTQVEPKSNLDLP
jgi:hypothetical protein